LHPHNVTDENLTYLATILDRTAALFHGWWP
jgi:hypothetical protein